MIDIYIEMFFFHVIRYDFLCIPFVHDYQSKQKKKLNVKLQGEFYPHTTFC